VGVTNKLVAGAVASSVRTGGRWVGKVIRSAWCPAALAAAGIGTLLGVTPALAQSATWLPTPTVTNPADGNFDFNANTRALPIYVFAAGGGAMRRHVLRG
jgi:ABC-type phosphate transport system permease subunit